MIKQHKMFYGTTQILSKHSHLLYVFVIYYLMDQMFTYKFDI